MAVPSIHAYRGIEVKYELSISYESAQMESSGQLRQTLTKEKTGEAFSIIQLLYSEGFQRFQPIDPEYSPPSLPEYQTQPQQ